MGETKGEISDAEARKIFDNAAKKKVKKNLSDEVKLPIVIKIAENIKNKGVTWNQDEKKIDTKTEYTDDD